MRLGQAEHSVYDAALRFGTRNESLWSRCCLDRIGCRPFAPFAPLV
jgi:hypothetical protein